MTVNIPKFTISLFFFCIAQELSQLTFQLLRRDSPGSEAFSLDSTSGVLTASRSIDRDVICARMEECVVRLQVSVEPGDFFQLIQVRS